MTVREPRGSRSAVSVRSARLGDGRKAEDVARRDREASWTRLRKIEVCDGLIDGRSCNIPLAWRKNSCNLMQSRATRRNPRTGGFVSPPRSSLRRSRVCWPLMDSRGGDRSISDFPRIENPTVRRLRAVWHAIGPESTVVDRLASATDRLPTGSDGTHE